MTYVVKKLLAAGGEWTVGTGDPVVQERGNGGLGLVERSGWALGVELTGLASGLGGEMRDWSRETEL